MCVRAERVLRRFEQRWIDGIVLDSDYIEVDGILVLTQSKGDGSGLEADGSYLEAERIFLNAYPSAARLIAETYADELMSFAVVNDRAELADRLVHDFGICDEDRYGLYVYEAARSASFDVLRVFVDSGLPTLGANVRYRCGSTPLHGAAAGGHVDIIKYLHEKGARLGSRDVQGFNPTNEASLYGNLDALCHLLNVGGNANLGLEVGLSFVADAIARTRADIVAALLRSASNQTDISDFLACMLQRKVGRPTHSTMAQIVSALLIEQGAFYSKRLTTEAPHTALACVAAYGSLEMLRFLLNETETGRAQVNRVVKKRWTPLSHAAAREPPEKVAGYDCLIVRELLRAGADLRLRPSKCAWSPLFEACLRGNVRLLKQLLRSGANPCAEKSSVAPLFYAAYSGSVKCINTLLAHGADPNDRLSGWLPLTGAIRGNSWPAARALLDGGAQLEAVSCHGLCPLTDSISLFSEGDPSRARVVLWSETFAKLAREYERSQCAISGTPILLVAAPGASAEDITRLLELGPEIDAEAEGLTAVIDAIGNANERAAVALVEAGADVNVEVSDAMVNNLYGAKALLVAVFGGSVNLIRFLVLDKGANVNEIFCGQATALWYAVHKGHCLLEDSSLQEVLTVLLELGADVNYCDPGTRSSVALRAAKSGRFDAVALLARNGADLSLRDSQGESILHHVVRSAPRQIDGLDYVEDIVEFGADARAVNFAGETCLHTAARYHADHNCSKLLALGAQVDARDHRGRTPLMLACVSKQSSSEHLGTQQSTISVLLSAGAETDARSNRGLVPLHYAARDGTPEVCRLLLLNNASVRDVARASGKTALHFAVESGNGATVSLLASRGAKLDAQDEKGRTPLHFAASRDSADLVSFLVDRGAKSDVVSIAGRTPLEVAKRKKHASVVRVLSTMCNVATVSEADKVGTRRLTVASWRAAGAHSLHGVNALVDLCVSCSDEFLQ